MASAALTWPDLPGGFSVCRLWHRRLGLLPRGWWCVAEYPSGCRAVGPFETREAAWGWLRECIDG